MTLHGIESDVTEMSGAEGKKAGSVENDRFQPQPVIDVVEVEISSIHAARLRCLLPEVRTKIDDQQ
jgi:hypothetical protein